MNYPVGYNRSLMIFLLVAYIIRVGRAAPLEKWEFPATEPGPSPPATPSKTPFQLLESARRAAASLAGDTARVSDKVLWSFGKMLLSAGESINYVWDAALHASVQLLKAGGVACSTIADRLAHVPVIGFGASGVREAVGVAVDAVASNVAHDTLVRSQAFAALNAKLNESGARLRPATGEMGGQAPATAATDPQGPVGHCSPAAELTPPATAADATSTAADATAAGADATTAVADSATTAADQPPPANEDNPSAFTTCKVQLYKSLSSLGRGTGMLMKAFSQAALTAFGFLIGSYDTLTSTTAATGEQVAKVVNLVNSATGNLVLVRDVTGGTATIVNSLTNTYRKNTDFNIESRGQMIKNLDLAIEKYHPESEAFLIPSAPNEGGAGGKTTDTADATAAAAPPKNDVDQKTDVTATAAAPLTTPPVLP